MSRGEIILYTVQHREFNITTKHATPDEHIKNRGCLVSMARYLGWNYWIWTFLDIKDLDNDYMDMNILLQGDLWVLSVPEEAVKWCALSPQCENRPPMWKWFSPNPELIRKAGDIPQGLIKAPVLKTWVSQRTEAKGALVKAGLWHEETTSNEK